MIVKRKTLFRNLPKKEFEKTKKDLETIRKARNKLMLKFPLNSMNRFVNEQGTECKKNCFIFIQSGGPQVFSEILGKFNDSAPTMEVCLRILRGCVRNIPDSDSIVDLSVPSLIQSVLQGDTKVNSKVVSDLAMEFLLGLSQFPDAHLFLNDAQIIDFLQKKIECFKGEGLENFKVDQLKVLGQVYSMASKFAQNREIQDQLEGFLDLISNLLTIYKRNTDTSFVRDLTLRILVNLSQHPEGRGLIRDSSLDVRAMANSVFQVRNLELDVQMALFLGNYVPNETVEEALGQIDVGNSELTEVVKEVIFLSYISKNEKYFEVFEAHKQTTSLLVKLLAKKDLREIGKAGTVSLLQGIIMQNKGLLSEFISLNVPSKVFSACRGLGYLSQAKGFGLLNACLKVEPLKVLKQLKGVKAVDQAITEFYSLKKRFEKYKEKSLDFQRALDSIEFQKSETTRIILESIKEFKRDKIVSMDLALEFLGCKDFLVSICKFFTVAFEHLHDYRECEKDFMSTSLMAIKIYRGNKAIHEAVFQTLSKMNFAPAVAKDVLTGKLPFQLCEILWRKNNWKLFAFYLLRFWDRLVSKKENLKYSQTSKFCIRLVASITHFVNDKDYDEIGAGASDVLDVGTQTKSKTAKKSELSFQQEREITSTGTNLLQKMIDTTMLDTFKTMVESQIRKFRPSTEGIQILRADYAVLAVLNGIAFFGNLGITENMQKKLYDNIGRLPKKEYEHKGKLMSDCVRAIANYIKITTDPRAVRIYSEGKVSVLVFDSLSSMLKDFKKPEDAWLVLRAFREWLLNRIKIIEEADDNMRYRIYDPESFLMTPETDRNRLVTDALDSLYGTYQNFPREEKVVALVFEVIVLLGYLYPRWRERVAKEFIPLALETLSENDFSAETDNMVLKALKYLTGTDDQSEEVVVENMESLSKNGGVESIAEAIARHDFDKQFIQESRPLLEALQNSSEAQEGVQKDIEKLIQVICDFEGLSEDEKKDPVKANELEDAIQKLNVLCLVPGLREVCFENGYNDHLKRLLDYTLNINRDDGLDGVWSRRMKRLAALGLNQTLDKSVGAESDKKKIDDAMDSLAEDGIESLLKTLQQEKNSPDIVKLVSTIVNKFFPGKNSQKVKEAAEKLGFQEDLEFILKEYGKSTDPDLCAETTNLYLNLSTKVDAEMTEKILKRLLREVDQSLEENDSERLINALKNICPFASDQIWTKGDPDFNMIDLVRKAMRLVHSNSTMKLEQEALDICRDSVKTQGVPGLSSQNKARLKDEIATSVEVIEILKGLDEDVKNKFMRSEDLVRMLPLVCFFNPTTNVYDIHGQLIKARGMASVLSEEGSFEVLTFALMKSNKDCFKAEEFDLSSVGLSALRASSIGAGSLRGSNLANLSQIPREELEKVYEHKNEQIRDNIRKYREVVDKLLDKKKELELVDRYIRDVERLDPQSENTRVQLLASSRLLVCALKAGTSTDTIKLRLNKLQKAFGTFLDKKEKEDGLGTDRPVDKKMWNFFTRIVRKTFKGVGLNAKQLQNKDLWNKLVLRYLSLSPQLLLRNKRKTLKNIISCVPKDEMPIFEEQTVFDENSGLIATKVDLSSTGLCRNALIAKSESVVDNLFLQLEEDNLANNVTVFTILQNLCLSSKVLSICRKTDFGCRVIDHVDPDNVSSPEELQVFTLTTQILRLVLDKKSQDQESLLIRVEQSGLTGKLVDLLEATASGDLPPEKVPFLDYVALTLKTLFQVSENRLVLAERGLPRILTEALHKSGICDAMIQRFQPGAAGFEKFFGLKNCLGLFMMTWNDRSLGNKYNTEEKGLMSQLLRLVDTRLKGVQNLKKFPFKVKSRIHEQIDQAQNGNIFVAEVVLYALGEFSETTDGREKLLRLSDNDETPLFKKMYVAFSKYDQLPVLATKCLQIARNLVIDLNQSQLEEVGSHIEEIAGDVKIKLAKFSDKNYQKIPAYLKDLQVQRQGVQDIKTLRQGQKMRALQIFGEALKIKLEREKIIDRDTLDSAFEVAKILKRSKENLLEIESSREQDDSSPEDAPQLSKPDKKNFETALDVLIEKLQKGGAEAFEFKNLETDLHLREIANCKATSMISRAEALQALNLLCNEVAVKKSMSRNDFFVEKSVEQISEIQTMFEDGDVSRLNDNHADILLRDLEFLKNMTDYRQGALCCLRLDSESSGQLVKGLFEVVLSDTGQRTRKFKQQALLTLLNLFKHSKDGSLEQELIDKVGLMLENNPDLEEIESPLVLIVGLLCSSSAERIGKNAAPEIELLEESIIIPNGEPDWKEKGQERAMEIKNELVTNKQIVPQLKVVMSNHPQSVPCLNNMSVAIHSIINDSPQFNPEVLESGIMAIMAKRFTKKINPELGFFYMNTLDSLLQLSYQNQEDKSKLAQMGFSKGLVALLIHFSSEKYYDEEMCLRVLKVMANFSLEEAGSSELLKDQIVPAFKNYFDQYKEQLSLHFEIMLSVLSNLTYERNPKVISMIEKQKGLGLILDCIAFYVEKKHAVCLEICLDCLTHMSSSPQTCEILENTPIMDLLVDILRQKLHGDLIYKDLRCLTIFADYSNLANRFFDKNGPAVSLDLLRPFAKDPKNVFSILKLNHELMKKYPEHMDVIVEAGVPEKVIRSFSRDWQIEIITLMMELFKSSAGKENVKVVISEMFLVELMRIMDVYFKKRKIVRCGASLLSVISDNVSSVNNLFYLEGNELSDRILKKYMSHSRTVMANLLFMENMIRLKDNDESKELLLELKTDLLVEKVTDTTDPDTQPKLNQQAHVVLELLRNKKAEIMEIEDLEKSELQDLEKKPKVLNTYRDTRPEFLHNQIPIDVQRFLRQGKILTLYGEDCVKRTMHFFLSSDLSDLKCKKPKEDNVKPKWIIPLHKVKKIKYGYNKDSPIAKSGGFFRKAPSNDRCFAVYGPETLDGPKNFHFECGSAERARQWFSHLTLVHNEYLSGKASKLKGKVESESQVAE